jgi:hypothetical protein
MAASAAAAPVAQPLAAPPATVSGEQSFALRRACPRPESVMRPPPEVAPRQLEELREWLKAKRSHGVRKGNPEYRSHPALASCGTRDVCVLVVQDREVEGPADAELPVERQCS